MSSLSAKRLSCCLASYASTNLKHGAVCRWQSWRSLLKGNFQGGLHQGSRGAASFCLWVLACLLNLHLHPDFVQGLDPQTSIVRAPWRALDQRPRFFIQQLYPLLPQDPRPSQRKRRICYPTLIFPIPAKHITPEEISLVPQKHAGGYPPSSGIFRWQYVQCFSRHEYWQCATHHSAQAGRASTRGLPTFQRSVS